jgi:hypothetical protein
MLPEISTTMRIAMPSLETLMASMPRCGRASARMHSTSARVRKPGSTQRKRVAREGERAARSVIEE